MSGFFDDRTDMEKTRQALTPTKKKKIMTALGNKCEKCKKKFPQRNLKVHHIEEVAKASGTKDLNTPSNLLVLCSICHDDVHHKPIPKNTQKGWIKKRPESVKAEIRRILRDRPKVSQTKTNPMEIDMPDIFGLSGHRKKKKNKDDWDFF